jgi:3D (Asp-Asp-Asp) domain-containing protein
LRRRELLHLLFALALSLFLNACGTTRRLPQYETPLVKTDFQTVRTTAYTHTESDHIEYGNHNALGGILQAAAPPIRSAAAVPRALPVYDSEVAPQPWTMDPRVTRLKRTTTTTTTWSRYPTVYGSAAADWSRWPAGTIFRVLSTGQVYRVEDYGWALAGRNTIDLYMATPNDMNSWGVRAEQIQILQWGDPQESLHLLSRHQDHRHIRRMVLELEGNARKAAALR